MAPPTAKLAELGSPDEANMAKIIDSKIDHVLMPLGIDFYIDFSVFWVPKWSHVGTKMGSKNNVNVEGRFFKNRALAAAGARFFIICWSKLGVNIEQKTI